MRRTDGSASLRARNLRLCVTPWTTTWGTRDPRLVDVVNGHPAAGLKVVCPPDGREPSRLQQTWPAGLGIPVRPVNHCPVQVGAHVVYRTVARHQTKDSQCISDFEKLCSVSERTIRHVQPLGGLLIAPCPALTIHGKPITSHYDGLIVARPGGGLCLLIRFNTWKCPDEGFGGRRAPPAPV